MHFGQKDTEDDSVRITIFLQSRPLHLKGVSFFTFPSSFIIFSSSKSLESTIKSEDEEDKEADAAVAAVEVSRVVDEAVGMGGGKSSSSPAPRPPPAFFAVVVDFADDDDILIFSTITKD